MKKEQMEQETRAKCAYVPPRVEAYATEPSWLMEVSGQHNVGIDDGEENGAKELNFNVSFSDVWEE